MNVKSTSTVERTLKKYTLALKNKTQMYRAKSPEMIRLATRHIAEKNPQSLILEQKYYRTVNPEAYNKIVQKTQAKEALKECREQHKNSITEIVRAFFQHPKGIGMRVEQEELIGKDTQTMQKRCGELLKELKSQN